MTTMADRFLREILRMHQLRRDINEMTFEAFAVPRDGEPIWTVGSGCAIDVAALA
jgi:hypothetical protein